MKIFKRVKNYKFPLKIKLCFYRLSTYKLLKRASKQNYIYKLSSDDKSLQGGKWAVTMHPVSIKSTLLFFLTKNFLEERDTSTQWACYWGAHTTSFSASFFLKYLFICLDISFLFIDDSQMIENKNVICIFAQCRRNFSHKNKMFLLNGVLKICIKFTGEHSCRSLISI